MELVVVPEKTRLHSGPERRLQRHPLSTVKSSQHLVARRPRRQTFEFSQEVVGERLSGVCRSDLQLAVQRLWHIRDLNDL